MKRSGLRPRFSFGRNKQGRHAGFQREYSFRKSWIAIAIVLVFDIIFLIPAYMTLQEAVALWRAPGDLFSLVAALFTSFWLLGWSMAPLLITAILLVMLFGREVVRGRAGVVEVSLGLPFVGITAHYDAVQMRNLRVEHPTQKSGRAWRGSHAVFDYGDNSFAFGSEVEDTDLAALQSSIETSTGVAIARGGAASAEVAETERPTEHIQSFKVADETPATLTRKAPVSAEKVGLASPSTLALIAANAVPLAGAIFWGWDLGAVMVLYWAESAIIGFFNLAKIVVIGRWKALFLGPFFMGHFGGFMAGHFLFLYTLFIEKPGSEGSGSADLDDVMLLFVSLWPALAVLFLSHAYSFFANFLGRREYQGRTMNKQMSEPYSRIIFMHLVLIFGGGLSLILGGATPVLVLAIAIKIVFDVRAHISQREAAEAVTGD